MEIHELRSIVEKVKRTEKSEEPFAFLEAYKEFEKSITIDNVENLITTIETLVQVANKYKELLNSAMIIMETNNEILACAIKIIANQEE
jgi:hypothetical protein